MQYAERAAALGHDALCLTDWNGVYGAVQLQQACKHYRLRPLIGCSFRVADLPVWLLAKNANGYQSMNQLLTMLHAQEEPRLMDWHAIEALEDCVILADSMLTVSNIPEACLPNTVLALDYQRRPGDARHARKLVAYAAEKGLRTCIAPDVRYALRDSYKAYDVLTCTRLGTSVFEPHPDRPVNDEQHLRSERDLFTLLPYPEAFATTSFLLETSTFDILPGYITPPSARLPANTHPDDVLRSLCLEAMPNKYSATIDAHKPTARAASHQLEHELEVIAELGLSDFFLVVKEIVDEASRRGIRHSGRGSAANSIVAYLLGITGVCPIQHHLLFERFLHRGRKGTPDIDVDFDSDRRQEIIDWMEQRFGNSQTAMTATLITYRARMAVRDVAKALGWPMDMVNALSKAIPGFTNKSPQSYRAELAAIVGDAPLLDTLIETVSLLLDVPRHLGLHSGGMILSSKPLSSFTPVQRSANGTSVVQFSKDDVEAMGLVKFDVLGLRMLACISEAVELIESDVSYLHHEISSRNDGTARMMRTDSACVVPPYQVRQFIDVMSFDDPNVMELIKSGQTLGLFQIESQGQMHLLAQHQPECFDDLVTEVALFRPGPLQGGMVHPYIRRRRGQESVQYAHPLLEPILRDTLGIVLFQEQVLEIAHRVAGMSLDDADDFRSLISKNRDPVAMAAMRERFVKGAMENGLDDAAAADVYDKVSHFVGYGFCRSHAAAFARIVYQSAWLKTYYPAAYLAAFMQHRPGFYNLMTLEEEARRFGVQTLMPDINRSGIRYSLELASDGRLAIRKPLSAIQLVTQDVARQIVWERMSGEYTSAEDVWQRLPIAADTMDTIALSGALDSVEGHSRRALWKTGVLATARTGAAGKKSRTTPRTEQQSGQLALSTHMLRITIDDVPELPPIKAQERLAYDYVSHGAARIHPMTLYRRVLNQFEIRPIEHLQNLVRDNTGVQNEPSGASVPATASVSPTATIAGIVILRQSPPTAKGVLFITLEDETGFVQCVVEPNEREYFREQLRHAALIIRGVVHARSNWRGVVVRDVRILRNMIGGYHGHPAMYGGTDTRELGLSRSNV